MRPLMDTPPQPPRGPLVRRLVRRCLGSVAVWLVGGTVGSATTALGPPWAEVHSERGDEGRAPEAASRRATPNRFWESYPPPKRLKTQRTCGFAPWRSRSWLQRLP